MQSRDFYGREDNKKKQLGNSSPATDSSGVCDEVSSHEEGCSSPYINTFFNVLPSGISPHIGGICLLGSIGEKEDLPLEEHEESEALVAKIWSEKREVPLKKYSVGPFLQYSKCQPDKSLEEGSFRRLSHEQVIEHVGGCHDFYDPMAEYMEGLGEGSHWLHPYFKDHFVYHFLLPLSISFLSIKHNKRTKLLGKLLDWIH